MPLLEVQLRRAGDELTGVKARVVPLPDDMLIRHATLYEDYKNTTHWPKHVMVHYHWIDEGDIDFNKGLYVLMTTGRLGVVQVASYLALWGDTAEHAGLLCAPLNLKLPVITSSQSADW
eukprot:GHUV01048848.1.p3 GENE.GHUV01048848.1~~GHUV01048848.1.p3  ORF type:complete len:119 (+),score=22.87 GHUV01048848.1:1342-1698(+)